MQVLSPSEAPRHWDVEDVTVTDPGIIRRAIGAASIGNVTEWYDFGVYAYFEPTIKEVFFADLGDTAGTIATFGLFAVAFLVRPFGGLFFGPLADRIGRKQVLAITMILMALGTFAIGCIPNESSIGVAAPLLLLLARLVQGFSTGGEYGNAMTFIAEYAPDRRRGFLGSFLELGTFTGYLLGAVLVTVFTAVLTDDQLLDWGWRLPFFVALPLGLVGVYLRTRLADTPAYEELERELEEAQESFGTQLREIFTLWPFLLVCMGLVLAWNVTNYMLTSYMPTYVTETMPDLQGGSGVSTTTSQLLQIVVIVVALVTIPLLGRLSDRIGRKPLLMTGAIGLVVLGAALDPRDPSADRSGRLRRAARDGVAADLLLGHLPVGAADALPHARPRGCAVDRVQRLRVAVRGHHLGRCRRTGRRHRRPELAGVLPDGGRADRRRVRALPARAQRPEAVGLQPLGDLEVGGERAGGRTAPHPLSSTPCAWYELR